MLTKKIIIISLFLLSVNTYSQSLYLGIGGGMAKVQKNNYYTRDLGYPGAHYVNGTLTMFGGLAFRKNYFASIKFKYELSSFGIIAQARYIPFRGRQSAEIYNLLYMQTIKEDVTTIIDVWSFGFGGRYIIDIDKFKPYAAVSLLMNYWGDTWFRFEYFDQIVLGRSYKNGMRFGLNFGLGVSYEIMKNVLCEIESNYNYMNLWNRRKVDPADELHPSSEEKMNTLNVEFTVYYRIY
jgi:opacity protein-like surface antigen